MKLCGGGRDEWQVATSGEIEDSGSTFREYNADATNLQDVRWVLDTLMSKTEVASATHVIYSYRFRQSDGSVLENFDSDGDYGMGLNLLKKMQQKNALNKLFVTTRSCYPGFAHLGSRRFEHAAEACFGATIDDSSD